MTREERRVRKVLGLWLNNLLGWTQQESDRIKASKKAEANHRRNRMKNKAARSSRKRNR